MKFFKWGSIFILVVLIFSCTGFSVIAVESDVVMVITSESENSFLITAHDPIGGGYIGDLTVKVWSANNSQDDIKSEVMNYADGQYTLSVSNSDHNNDKGQYFIELYGPSGLLKSDFTTLAVDANEWVYVYRYNDGTIEKLICRATLVLNTEINKSTQEANSGVDFKSGYGFTTTYNSTVTSNVEVDAANALTGSGNARLTYSEFNFNQGVTINGSFSQFNRLTDCTNRDTSNNVAVSTLEMKTNPFSASEARVHFTPILYPDNTTYAVNAEVFDAWSPAGMLSTSISNSFAVNGNVYDDWQVNETR